MDIYRAAWVIPVDSPPIPNGAVAVKDGRFAFVGPARDAPAGSLHDLGDVALLPGFVNAHTHLELTAFKGRIAPKPLWDWFDELLRLISSVNFAELGSLAIRDGATQSLAAGVTCVADISRTALHVPILAESTLRTVCFVELISGARLPPNDPESLARTIETHSRHAVDHHLILGLAPHSPYTVLTDHLKFVADLAHRRRLPVTLHALETTDERDWFAGAPSRIGDFLQGSRPWLAIPTSPTGGLIALLRDTGLDRCRPLLAHVNYADDALIGQLAQIGASVAFCPRAHAYFQHAPHRWRDMLAAGINVCLGTDSLASNDSLSILDEIRFLQKATPDCPPSVLLKMATLRGAHALGLGDQLGSITPGKLADWVCIPIRTSTVDAMNEITHGDARIHSVWIKGSRRV